MGCASPTTPDPQATIVELSSSANKLPTSVASAAVPEMTLASRPRWRLEPDSSRNDAEPVHSPPAERPCTQRNSTRSSGATTPMLAYGGMKPIRPVARPMPTTEMVSEVRRPKRSPIGPRMKPPSGRAKKPTAKTASAESAPTTGESLPKNSLPMMIAKKP